MKAFLKAALFTVLVVGSFALGMLVRPSAEAYWKTIQEARALAATDEAGRKNLATAIVETSQEHDKARQLIQQIVLQAALEQLPSQDVREIRATIEKLKSEGE